MRQPCDNFLKVDLRVWASIHLSVNGNDTKPKTIGNGMAGGNQTLG